MKLKLISLIAILLMFHCSGWTQSIQMKVCTNDGKEHFFNIAEIRKLTFLPSSNVNVQKINAAIRNFNLLKCYPNPFNSSTTINYSLLGKGTVDIKITDLNGKTIRSIPVGNQSSGDYIHTWDGKTNSGDRTQPGIYFCTIKFNNQIQTNKIVLIK